jgi:uncharacterized protein YndB with AHSA1/START domain
MTGIVATASIDIDAAPEVVWQTLTDADAIEQFMFGTRIETDWHVGSSISWKGEYEGRAYEDKGQVLAVDPRRRLEHTHFSALSGKSDEPANYHTLVYTLEESGAGTTLTLEQDNNPTEDAAARAAANWDQMLAGVKRIVEENRPPAPADR